MLVVEVTSALQRRSGDFAPARLEATWRRFSKDRTRWRLVAVSQPLLARAEQVVRSAGLRALDAIHVATAVLLVEELRVPVSFVTGDEAQAAAALEFGLPAVVIN